METKIQEIKETKARENICTNIHKIMLDGLIQQRHLENLWTQTRLRKRGERTQNTCWAYEEEKGIAFIFIEVWGSSTGETAEIWVLNVISNGNLRGKNSFAKQKVEKI